MTAATRSALIAMTCALGLAAAQPAVPATTGFDAAPADRIAQAQDAARDVSPFRGLFSEPGGSILSDVSTGEAPAAEQQARPRGPAAIPIPDGMILLLSALGFFALAGWRVARSRPRDADPA